MNVSVVIPTLNEAEHIGRLIKRLQTYGGDLLREIIIVDAGSDDETVSIARNLGTRVINSSSRGRALQMNLGAEHTQSEVVYFVHADTLPPICYMESIQKALRQDFQIGCFRYQFDSPRMLLKINAFFTRFPMLWCRGGDQSLFVTKDLFKTMNGFRGNYVIMEDFEFIKRVRSKYPFKIIQKDMIVSARKYKENSYMRVQIANLIVFNMYRFGYSQERMVNTYRRLLKQVKN